MDEARPPPRAGRRRRGRHPRPRGSRGAQGRLHRRRLGGRRRARAGPRARRAPDLAVLDVSMPGATGLEVCAALRADPATAGIRILLLSAGASLDDVAARPRRRRRRLPGQAVPGLRTGAPGARAHGEAAGMTTLEAGTAVLRRPAPRRSRLAAGLTRRHTVLDRALPSTALFAVAAVLLATGALPVADGELVLAGLAAAFLGHRWSPVSSPGPPSPGTSRSSSPLPQPRRRRRCCAAGTGVGRRALPGARLPSSRWSPAPAGAASCSPALGTAAVLLAARAARGSTLPAAPLGGALLLGPLAVGLGGLGVNETARRSAGRRPASTARGRARRSCWRRCRPAPTSSTWPPACSPPARRR